MLPVSSRYLLGDAIEANKMSDFGLTIYLPPSIIFARLYREIHGTWNEKNKIARSADEIRKTTKSAI